MRSLLPPLLPPLAGGPDPFGAHTPGVSTGPVVGVGPPFTPLEDPDPVVPVDTTPVGAAAVPDGGWDDWDAPAGPTWWRR